MKKEVMIILISLLLLPVSLRAQTHEDFDSLGYSLFTDFKYDTNMVTSYEHLFGLEAYVQQKNLSLNYKGENANSVKYAPNSSLALGLGFTYRYLALSAVFNVLPIAQDTGVKTKTFDFQSQIASYRFLSFITAQLYKGLSSEQIGAAGLGGISSRSDMGMTLLGLNNMYSLNRKYSFRGSVLRFQRMRYSVGTPLIALEGNYFLKSGDAPFVPSAYQSFYELNDARRRRIWNVGLGTGYAYTWVVNKRLLFAGIATIKVPINIIQDKKIDGSKEASTYTGLNGNLWLRGSYEREDWSISLHYIQNRMLVGDNLINYTFSANYGMARLIFSKRFGINRKFKKALKPIDAILDIPYHVIGKK
jgi:hypothetical protein